MQIQARSFGGMVGKKGSWTPKLFLCNKFLFNPCPVDFSTKASKLGIVYFYNPKSKTSAFLTLKL